jgi:hypothetical protein
MWRGDPWTPRFRGFRVGSYAFRQDADGGHSRFDVRAADRGGNERMNPLLGQRQAPSGSLRSPTGLQLLVRDGLAVVACPASERLKPPQQQRKAPQTARGFTSSTARTPKMAQNRVRAPRDVPMASLRRVSASCAILESRIFDFGPAERDPCTRQALAGRPRPRCVIAALQKRRNVPRRATRPSPGSGGPPRPSRRGPGRWR